MNTARIHMKSWIATKNEHKAKVQRRWDNRGCMNKAFQTWKKKITYEQEGKVEGVEGRSEREKTKENTKTPEMGASGHLGPSSSKEELIPYHTIDNNRQPPLQDRSEVEVG
eukprot:2582323-Pleurochrysis_carterae.AAC.1